MAIKIKLIKDEHLITVLLCALAIPLSMSMWIINLVYSKFLSKNEGFDGHTMSKVWQDQTIMSVKEAHREGLSMGLKNPSGKGKRLIILHIEPVVISPGRWLASCLIPLIITAHGYRKKSISLSGAVLGCALAFVLTLSNYSFLVCLTTFFLSSSRATKVRSHIKRKIEEDFKEGGQRNWVQVLCNGGMAAQLALLYLLDVGASERPIDFVGDYRASWLSIGILGVFACCNGDTWASELGTVFSNSDPYLITTFKKVPKGTNGAISVVGTLFSTVGGLAIGFSQYITLYYFSEKNLWAYAPPQWPIIFFGALGGFLGSVIDSLMGATLQYSGLDKEGKVVSHSSVTVKHISGRNILDNHSVNLISTVIMGLLMPTLCKSLWPLF